MARLVTGEAVSLWAPTAAGREPPPVPDSARPAATHSVAEFPGTGRPYSVARGDRRRGAGGFGCGGGEGEGEGRGTVERSHS